MDAADRTDLTRGWRFQLTEHPAADKDFDDSGWRVVDLPHDWSIEARPRESPDTTPGTGFLPGGIGWYRKEFVAPSAGERLSVEFDRIYMDATVYLNGTLVGRHAYGYTGFSVDLTGLAHGDEQDPDVLAVRVNHQVPSSRWYSGSGILGRVRLITTGHVHVRRWGTRVTTPGLETATDSATVAVHTQLGNSTGDTAQVEVTFTVVDGEGREAVRAKTSASVPPGGSAVASQLHVDSPVLWSTQHPHLYTMHVEVTEHGRIVDHDVTTFGLRHFRFDPDAGFFLNGSRVELQGVNLHHDQGALGAVADPDAIQRQVDLMRRMGANAIRTAHNPPAPELLDACQRSGVLLLVEAFDCWSRGKNPYDYGRFFDTDGELDITEMVQAARNCPSVIMWSIGNEIPDAVSPAGLDMARRLVAAVRAADDTRPVVLCSDQYRVLPEQGSVRAAMLDLVDGLGVNYNTGASMDALHAAYPRLFLFESESSAQCSTRGVYEQPELPNVAENHTPGRRGASSYDNNLVTWALSGEYVLKQHRDRAFTAGHFLWSGMDYIGEPTPFWVFPVKASFFGATDTAGFPKDQYYLFQSQWTTTPMVHLLPMDWTRHRPGEVVEVRAYSNVDSVELLLDGRSLGTRTATAEKLHLTWRVPFRPGTLTATARRLGVVVARDELRTAGPAHALRLTPDRAAVPGGSLAFITAEVVDRHGTLVPGAAHPINFEVAGGALAGLDNGRQESAEPYQGTNTRTAFHGKALAIVRCGTGPAPVVVTARSAGLVTAGATVQLTEPSQHHAAPPPPQIPPANDVHPALTADASYSGHPDTIPAAMLDDVPGTGWSNASSVAATAVLPRFDSARAADWVSLTWPAPREVTALSVTFMADERHALPAAVDVSYVDDNGAVGSLAPHPRQWSGATLTISFPPIRVAHIRLDLVSARPGRPDGFLGIVSMVPA